MIHLFVDTYKTPIGTLTLIATDTALVMAQFAATPAGPSQSGCFTHDELSDHPIIAQARRELDRYFAGEVFSFSVPLALKGTDFQRRTWEQLRRVPYGTTTSYREQAASIGQPSAYRAVARANGANNLVIFIPCHRVIHAQGTLSGYRYGVERKAWLIAHEQKHRA